MRQLQWAWMVAVLLVSGAAVVSGQALDRNAQRIVNDATKDLKSKDVQKRVDAIDNLRAWGKLTMAPLIIGALRDPDARVRAVAADALWNDDMKTEAARAPLTAALDDPAPEVAVLAAGALRVLGASKADVQKANERGLSSRDPRIRFLAARALIGLTPPARLVDPLNTPLMMAASGGCDAVIMNALLKAGAKLNAVNQAGLTAFEFGLFAGHDGLDALVAAGYRLPAAKVKLYLEAYKANPKSVALIKRAAQ